MYGLRAGARVWGAAAAESGDFPAQFVLDMRPDDAVEVRLDREAERERPLGIEPARPAGDDARHEFVRLAADGGRSRLTRHTAERRDLLAHGAAHARHGQVDAAPELLAREGR